MKTTRPPSVQDLTVRDVLALAVIVSRCAREATIDPTAVVRDAFAAADELLRATTLPPGALRRDH